MLRHLVTATPRRLDPRVPAPLVDPVLRAEPEPLLAAAVGHPTVQRHVAVVRLCGFVDGPLGLFTPERQEQTEQHFPQKNKTL